MIQMVSAVMYNLSGLFLFAFLLYFKKQKHSEVFLKGYNLPFVVFSTSCVLESFTHVLHLYHIEVSTNMWVLFYSFVETFFNGKLFQQMLPPQYHKFVYVYYVGFVVVFAFVHLMYSMEQRFVWDSIMVAFAGVAVFVLSFVWLAHTFAHMPDAKLFSNPNYLFVCGLVLYYAGTVLFFLLSQYLYTNSPNLLKLGYEINTFFTVTQRVFFIFGLWRLHKNYNTSYG